MVITGDRDRMQRQHVVDGTWTIPTESSKNRAPSIVPLPEKARALLDALPEFTGPYVLSTTAGHKPIAGFAKAKVRMDATLAELAASGEAVEVAPWRFHDLRRTLSTGLARLGVLQVVTDEVLNHKASGAVRGVARIYNRYAFLDEKQAALEAWARRLDAIVAGTRATVTPIAEAGHRRAAP